MREEERSLDVHAQNLAKGVALDLVKRFVRSGVDGRVVHEDVQHGRCCQRLLRHAGNALVSAEIADDRHAAELVRECLCSGVGARMAEDVRPFRSEAPRDRGPDSTRGTRDERILAAQHHPSRATP